MYETDSSTSTTGTQSRGSLRLAAADWADDAVERIRRRGWNSTGLVNLDTGAVCLVGALGPRDLVEVPEGQDVCDILIYAAVEQDPRIETLYETFLYLTETEDAYAEDDDCERVDVLFTWNDHEDRTPEDVTDVLTRISKELRDL